MFYWIMRGLIIIIGPIVGYLQISRDIKGLFIGLGIALGVVIIEFIIERIPLDTLVAGVLGGVLGLIFAKMLDYLVYLYNPAWYEVYKKYSLFVNIVFTYLGLIIAIRKKDELELLEKDIFPKSGKKQVNELVVLDTSIIIDGRVVDIITTKFLTCIFVVPKFVLRELQNLADHSDTNIRTRGRRGLDILARVQETPDVVVKILDKDYPQEKEVDAKLIMLAKDLQAKVLTTDYNLNRVATLEGVTVLNVNDLANALKPVALPGEKISIFILKDGKERDQGVAYFDDGTMIVVEDGHRMIGKKAEVVITSILQTSSGRMVFAKLANGGGYVVKGKV
ncbi:MAG: PIN domain-containing protein [Elusimicrobiota bacterium]